MIFMSQLLLPSTDLQWKLFIWKVEATQLFISATLVIRKPLLTLCCVRWGKKKWFKRFLNQTDYNVWNQSVSVLSKTYFITIMQLYGEFCFAIVIQELSWSIFSIWSEGKKIYATPATSISIFYNLAGYYITL